MASRFVSGGTIAGDGQGEPQPAPASPPKVAQNAQWDKEASKKNIEWEAVQRELEADKRRREEARRAQVEGGGENKSLFDILQANKAAKQAAFEEQNRIRNQFRALDDDEIDFLDGVLDERRTEEERIKRETAERLASFREAQKTAGVTEETGDTNDDAAVTWVGAGKKRKRSEKDAKSIVKGVRKRTSESEKDVDRSVIPGAAVPQPASEPRPQKIEAKATSALKTDASAKPSAADQAKPAPAKPQEKPNLGLVDYGSDEDEDD
ncbi:hypothetical protein F4818DRAFT_353939 [Hypoxylon cercidicola]|nr:hypothetical protein F4818DRAFT_353939 [Hypoxylon cercidicola]